MSAIGPESPVSKYQRKQAKILTDNDTFARLDVPFRKACERAGVEPTRKQASKWRREIGLAYKYGREPQEVKP